MAEDSAECVVIGGGITGASIAYHLGKLGCGDVILLEKDHLASKATGICPGGIRAQWQSEIACLYAREAIRFFENLDEELRPDFPLPFHQTGYLFVARRETTLETFRRNVALQNRLGIPSAIVDAAQIGELVPELRTDEVAGGSFCATDGFIEDADGLTQLLAARAREQGARVRFEPALSIERRADRITGVRTPAGRIDAPNVVLAAGCDSGPLAEPLGVHLPITVERRRLVFTSRVERRVLDPLVADLDTGWAGKQLIDGVIYMGYLRETREPASDWEYTEKVAELFMDHMPSLSDVGVTRVVDGDYDTSPDGHPFLGGVAGLVGYYHAVGFSGHGYMLSPSVGKVVSELILGREPSLPTEPLSLERFRKESAEDGLVI